MVSRQALFGLFDRNHSGESDDENDIGGKTWTPLLKDFEVKQRPYEPDDW